MIRLRDEKKFPIDGTQICGNGKWIDRADQPGLLVKSLSHYEALPVRALTALENKIHLRAVAVSCGRATQNQDQVLGHLG